MMTTHVINGPDLKAVASDAVTAAATGGTSAIVQGLVGVVAGLFGGGKGSGQLSPEFKAFIQSAGAGAFEQWCKVNKPEALGWSRAQFLPLFYVWLLDTGKSILWASNSLNPTDPAFYVKGLTEDAFKAIGVDYWASAANRQRGIETVTNGRWDGWVMLPGGGTPQAPTPGVNKVQQALNSVGNAISDGARQVLQQKIDDLKGGAPPDEPKDNTGTLLLVGLGLALVASQR